MTEPTDEGPSVSRLAGQLEYLFEEHPELRTAPVAQLVARLNEEDRLARAHDLGHLAGYAVDPTGTAGLAGLLDLLAAGDVGPDDRVGVLFTGVDR